MHCASNYWKFAFSVLCCCVATDVLELSRAEAYELTDSEKLALTKV